MNLDKYKIILKLIFTVLLNFFFLLILTKISFVQHSFAQSYYECNWNDDRGCYLDVPCPDGWEPANNPPCSDRNDLDCLHLGTLCQPSLRCSEDRVHTAIGCVSFNSITALTSFILTWAIGVAGGIAFLLIVYAGFIITTSAGDPKKLQAGKELLTSAVSGLLLMIFSVFILRLIGVNILRIPGL